MNLYEFFNEFNKCGEFKSRLIGSRLIYKKGTYWQSEYMICSTDTYRIGLVEINSGRRWKDSIKLSESDMTNNNFNFDIIKRLICLETDGEEYAKEKLKEWGVVGDDKTLYDRFCPITSDKTKIGAGTRLRYTANGLFHDYVIVKAVDSNTVYLLRVPEYENTMSITYVNDPDNMTKKELITFLRYEQPNFVDDESYLKRWEILD